MNRQLLLDLGVSVPQTLENFVAGRNLALMAILKALVCGARDERQVHLWAEPASGKTHLLRALGTTMNARYLCCRDASPRAFEWEDKVTLWTVDDVQSATDEVQIALFNLINEVRMRPDLALVTASDQPPPQMRLRHDLRTRLLWGPVFQVERLNDSEREAALTKYALERGLELPLEVCHYLLTRFSRDMSSLIDLLGQLDRYALEEHRQLTLPLVREWLLRARDSHPVS